MTDKNDYLYKIYCYSSLQKATIYYGWTPQYIAAFYYDTASAANSARTSS